MSNLRKNGSRRPTQADGRALSGRPEPGAKASPENGFSLLELLIVVALIGIISAIAIPSLSSSQRAGNEANAIAYLRNWTTAQELYLLRFGAYADADSQLLNAGLIGKGVADSHGYVFSLDNPPGSTTTWWGTGNPVSPGISGSRYFFIDETGVIRYSTSGAANGSSPPM